VPEIWTRGQKNGSGRWNHCPIRAHKILSVTQSNADESGWLREKPTTLRVQNGGLVQTRQYTSSGTWSSCHLFASAEIVSLLSHYPPRQTLWADTVVFRIGSGTNGRNRVLFWICLSSWATTVTICSWLHESGDQGEPNLSSNGERWDRSGDFIGGSLATLGSTDGPGYISHKTGCGRCWILTGSEIWSVNFRPTLPLNSGWGPDWDPRSKVNPLIFRAHTWLWLRCSHNRFIKIPENRWDFRTLSFPDLSHPLRVPGQSTWYTSRHCYLTAHQPTSHRHHVSKLMVRFSCLYLYNNSPILFLCRSAPFIVCDPTPPTREIAVAVKSGMPGRFPPVQRATLTPLFTRRPRSFPHSLGTNSYLLIRYMSSKLQANGKKTSPVITLQMLGFFRIYWANLPAICWVQQTLGFFKIYWVMWLLFPH